MNAADIAFQEGYTSEAVATGFSFPTGLAFGDRGRVYVTEAGYSYGEVVTVPRFLRSVSKGQT